VDSVNYIALIVSVAVDYILDGMGADRTALGFFLITIMTLCWLSMGERTNTISNFLTCNIQESSDKKKRIRYLVGEVCTGFWWGSLRERDHWGDPDVDGRIILRRIFWKWEAVVGTGWGGLRIGTGGGHL
jgi:hypothetical protein